MKEVKIEEWLKKNVGLDDNWEVLDVKFYLYPTTINSTVGYKGPFVCPVCGMECTRYDTRRRTWRDIDFGDSVTNITAIIPRMNCPNHGVREIEVPWSGRSSNLTRRFEIECLNHSLAMPVHLAAGLLNLSDRTIWKIIRRDSDYGMRSLDLTEMRAVCIDETSSEKGHNYISLFVNPATGGIVFATIGRDHSTIVEFKIWLIHHGCNPDTIGVVCCDMSPAYIKGIRECFPNATIVFDKFHVVKTCNDTLDMVRKKSGLKGKKGKGLRFCFLKNREELDEDTRARIDSVMDDYFYIGKAYSIKESIRDLYAISDPLIARQVLYSIIDRCLDSENDDIFDLGITLDRHSEGILAWFNTKINNGISEGNNSVIQAMKRTARGFSEPENMIALIYLRNFAKNGISY